MLKTFTMESCERIFQKGYVPHPSMNGVNFNSILSKAAEKSEKSFYEDEPKETSFDLVRDR